MNSCPSSDTLQTYWKMTPKSKGFIDKTNKVVLPIKYTPDFVAKDGSWIIETKGYIHSHHDFPMRWKLFMDYLMKLGEPLPMLFICRNHTTNRTSYLSNQIKQRRMKKPKYLQKKSETGTGWQWTGC